MDANNLFIYAACYKNISIRENEKMHRIPFRKKRMTLDSPVFKGCLTEFLEAFILKNTITKTTVLQDLINVQ